ncbi:MAG: hypothetical protein EBU59_13815, partial [Planctomycetia bacterium]|nr:hypothetical protein [Planctomycetia bacterium]
AEFNVPLSESAFVHSSLELPDGKVLLVGTDNGDVVVTRHLATGALDATFADGGLARVHVLNAADEGYRATLSKDGKILVTGFAHNGVNNDIVVLRLNHNGTLDNSFDTDGKMSVNLGDDDRGYAIAVTADDKIIVAGKSGSDIALIQLLGDSDQSALPVNQAPVISVPGAQTATVDQPYAFTAYRDNLISVTDADAGENHLQVTLSVDTGTLTLVHDDPSGGLTYTTTASNNDGYEDQSLSFTGTLDDINKALSWVSYLSAPATTGDATLTITVSDNGHIGTGGAKEVTETIAITVAEVAAFAASPTHHTLASGLDTTLANAVLNRSEGLDVIYDIEILKGDDANTGKLVAVGAVNDRLVILRFNADLSL